MVKDMTEQEKIEFAQNIYSDKCQKALKYGNRYIKSGMFWGIGGAVAIGVVLALNLVPPSFFLPLALFMWVDFTGWDFFRGFRAVFRAVKDASYGKVSYREYRKLVKSGELEQWAKGNAKGDVVEQPAVTQTTTKDDGGVQLSAEEVAVLKKIMEKKGIANVEELQTTDQQPSTATKTPTDNGRNS